MDPPRRIPQSALAQASQLGYHPHVRRPGLHHIGPLHSGGRSGTGPLPHCQIVPGPRRPAGSLIQVPVDYTAAPRLHPNSAPCAGPAREAPAGLRARARGPGTGPPTTFRTLAGPAWDNNEPRGVNLDHLTSCWTRTKLAAQRNAARHGPEATGRPRHRVRFLPQARLGRDSPSGPSLPLQTARDCSRCRLLCKCHPRRPDHPSLIPRGRGPASECFSSQTRREDNPPGPKTSSAPQPALSITATGLQLQIRSHTPNFTRNRLTAHLTANRRAEVFVRRATNLYLTTYLVVL